MNGPIVGAQFWYDEWNELAVVNERLLVDNQKLDEEFDKLLDYVAALFVLFQGKRRREMLSDNISTWDMFLRINYQTEVYPDDTGTTTVVEVAGTAGQDAGDLRETGCYREVCLPAEGEEIRGG